MTCPHTPTQNLLSAVFNEISDASLEARMAAKMAELYDQSLKQRDRGCEINRAGYKEIISQADTQAGVVPDLSIIPENHAGLELFIEKRFPHLYKNLKA